MEKTFSQRVDEAKLAVAALTPQEAAAMKQCPTVVFVDPRPAKAIAETTGIITGARNVVLDDIVSGNLPGEFDKSHTHVITACQGGPMGAIAAHEFQKQGFAQVNYMEGGTQGWIDAGFATTR